MKYFCFCSTYYLSQSFMILVKDLFCYIVISLRQIFYANEITTSQVLKVWYSRTMFIVRPSVITKRSHFYPINRRQFIFKYYVNVIKYYNKEQHKGDHTCKAPIFFWDECVRVENQDQIFINFSLKWSCNGM